MIETFKAWNRAEKDAFNVHAKRDKHVSASLGQIIQLNHTARQWGCRFSEKEHMEIAARHPDSGMHPDRLERLRMIREGETVFCRCCGASVGLYDEVCAACGEDI